MKVGVSYSTHIHSIVAEINDTPADNVVLVFVMAMNGSAEHPVHEQASVFARTGQVGWRNCTPLGRLLTPFTEHEYFGLREAFVGIGELRLMV